MLAGSATVSSNVNNKQFPVTRGSGDDREIHHSILCGHIFYSFELRPHRPSSLPFVIIFTISFHIFRFSLFAFRFSLFSFLFSVYQLVTKSIQIDIFHMLLIYHENWEILIFKPLGVRRSTTRHSSSQHNTSKKYLTSRTQCSQGGTTRPRDPCRIRVQDCFMHLREWRRSCPSQHGERCSQWHWCSLGSSGASKTQKQDPVTKGMCLVHQGCPLFSNISIFS